MQVAAATDELLATHRMFTGPVEQADAVVSALSVVQERRAVRTASLLVRTTDDAAPPPGWQSEASNLEEIVLGYLRSPGASALPGPNTSTSNDAQEVLT